MRSSLIFIIFICFVIIITSLDVNDSMITENKEILTDNQENLKDLQNTVNTIEVKETEKEQSNDKTKTEEKKSTSFFPVFIFSIFFAVVVVGAFGLGSSKPSTGNQTTTVTTDKKQAQQNKTTKRNQITTGPPPTGNQTTTVQKQGQQQTKRILRQKINKNIRQNDNTINRKNLSYVLAISSQNKDILDQMISRIQKLELVDSLNDELIYYVEQMYKNTFSDKNKNVVDAMLNMDGLDLNRKHHLNEKTILMFAAQNGDLDMVKKLIEEKNVDISITSNAYSSYPYTALTFAIEQNKKDVIEYLLEKNIIKNDENYVNINVKKGYLSAALQDNQDKLAKRLIDEYNVEVHHDHLVTVIQNHKYDLGFIKDLLLKKGPTPNMYESGFAQILKAAVDTTNSQYRINRSDLLQYLEKDYDEFNHHDLYAFLEYYIDIRIGSRFERIVGKEFPLGMDIIKIIGKKIILNKDYMNKFNVDDKSLEIYKIKQKLLNYITKLNFRSQNGDDKGIQAYLEEILART